MRKNMALTQKDFLLTEEQLDEINGHFAKQAAAYAMAGADPAWGIKVEFEWVPGFGRFVTANFDSEANGLEIEGYSPPKKTET